jgi:hypothetical protein
MHDTWVRPMPTKSVRYPWRCAVLSDNGPECPGMRHVLITMNHHMDNSGRCFPGIALIARETRLDERTVRRHLTAAVKLGWLKRESRRTAGRAWRKYEYQAAYPQGAGIMPAPNARGAGTGARGAGNNDRDVRAPRPINLSVNLSRTAFVKKPEPIRAHLDAQLAGLHQALKRKAGGG